MIAVVVVVVVWGTCCSASDIQTDGSWPLVEHRRQQQICVLQGNPLVVHDYSQNCSLIVMNVLIVHAVMRKREKKSSKEMLTTQCNESFQKGIKKTSFTEVESNGLIDNSSAFDSHLWQTSYRESESAFH